ncbi:MAG: peroxide stress protein YaaA, partial [Planctomycetota bacterium]|nr:peroxide stress protein YaaA [Planctomycetota bacterium]
MAGLFAILSPAKTLDMAATLSANTAQSSRPRLGGRTRQLASQLEGYSPKKLASLMSLSPKLVDLNVERWSSFGSRTNPRATAA